MVDEKIQKAQRLTGRVMLNCLQLWYAPVLSGVLCNVAEKQMVKRIVGVILERKDDELAEKIFWFHRKKLFIVDMATYLPYAGPPFQILEVYSLGQFAIRFLTRYSERSDDVVLDEVWASVEADMHSAAQVIESFHEFTGRPLPPALVGPVTFAVEKFHAAVQALVQDPYLGPGQEFLGTQVERASHKASDAFSSFLGLFRRSPTPKDASAEGSVVRQVD